MRRFLDKWGTAIAAVACALTIVFAAVYTRQDDLKRIAAQEARAAQDQSLPDAQAETVWARPVPSAPSEGFRGAYRDEHGLWRMQPYTRYPAAYGQSVTAVCAGEVLTVSGDSLTYRCAGGETITCAGLSSVMVKIGDTGSAWAWPRGMRKLRFKCEKGRNIWTWKACSPHDITSQHSKTMR